MSGKLKAAVYVAFTATLSFLVLALSSGAGIDAATWNAEYQAKLFNYAASEDGASANTCHDLIDNGDVDGLIDARDPDCQLNTPGATADSWASYDQYFPNANFAKVDTTHMPSSFWVAQDYDMQDGTRVGQIISFTTLSLLNAPCASPITVTVPFMDGTTDIYHTADWKGSGTTLVFDDDADTVTEVTDAPDDNNDVGEDDNGLPTYADHYPSYLNDIFDPDGPAGTAKPLAPRARYVGHQQVILDAPATQLNFVIFGPGDLAAGGMSMPENALDDSYGYVNFVVLNNPSLTSPSTITGFCTTLNTITTLHGRTQGRYIVVDGPEPIEVDRTANQCTQIVNDPGPKASLIPDGGDDADSSGAPADGVVDDGCLFIPDPCVDVDYTGDTTVSAVQGEDPAPATDNDGDVIIDEGCGVLRAENPPPNSGVYGTGTHVARGFSQGNRDYDSDGKDNEDDICVIHALHNTNLGAGDTDLDTILDENDPDDDNDGLGDACDPAPMVPSAGAPNADGTNQDGDSWPAAVGPAEAGLACTGTAAANTLPHKDDDGDTTINDGCGAAINEDRVNNADDDGDTRLDEDGECRGTNALPDQDQDCYSNRNDNCPLVSNRQSDFDEGLSAGDAGPTSDHIGDECEPDYDGDTVADPEEAGLDAPTGEAPGGCGNAVDNDGDGRVNDGCPSAGSRPEIGAECSNATNDDKDTKRTLGTGDDINDDALINDGCPRYDGGQADGTSQSNVPIDYVCVFDPEGSDDTDDNGDSDNDDDGVCDSTEVLLGSDKDVRWRTPEYIGLEYDDLPADSAGPCSDLSAYGGGYPPMENDGDSQTNANDPGCAGAYNGTLGEDGAAPNTCSDTLDNGADTVADQYDFDCHADPLAGDTDDDGVPDAVDTCIIYDNPEQVDSDGDEGGDDCDTDDDNDGTPDVRESYLGTDPKDGCSDDASDDAWAYDFDGNQQANIIDVLFFGSAIGKAVTAAPDYRRFDYDANGAVNIIDVLFFGAPIGKDCWSWNNSQIVLANDTGQAVDGIYIEPTFEITMIKSAVDSDGKNWTRTAPATLPSYYVELERGAQGNLADLGTLTLKLDGKRTPISIRCYDWTLGLSDELINGSDRPCYIENDSQGVATKLHLTFASGRNRVVVMSDTGAIIADSLNDNGDGTTDNGECRATNAGKTMYECHFAAAVADGADVQIRHGISPSNITAITWLP